MILQLLLLLHNSSMPLIVTLLLLKLTSTRVAILAMCGKLVSSIGVPCKSKAPQRLCFLVCLYLHTRTQDPQAQGPARTTYIPARMAFENFRRGVVTIK
jgi:hypothetical protein